MHLSNLRNTAYNYTLKDVKSHSYIQLVKRFDPEETLALELSASFNKNNLQNGRVRRERKKGNALRLSLVFSE